MTSQVKAICVGIGNHGPPLLLTQENLYYAKRPN